VGGYQFPTDFAWGAATSAYQIEGAVDAGGRSPSVWDTFSALPGRIRDGSTGAIACDHYHRFLEDVKLMAALGIRHYRFSVSWSRVLPEGRGRINSEGLAFYSRLVDALLAHDITPHVTLFHWDSPQALEERYGSWQSRDMVQDFADYTAVVVRHLGDRVTHWMTINEITCFTHMGYGVKQVPVHAPGTRVDSLKAVWQTSHHALLAHGAACQVIRATSPQPCSVALVDNPVVPVPLVETAEHIAAAHHAFRSLNPNGGLIVPALTGQYSPELLERLGKDAPTIEPGDLKLIHQPLDHLGLNIYTGVYVRAVATPPGYEVLPFSEAYPRLHMPWLHLLPDSLYWAIRHIRESLGQAELPLVVSENGCAAADHLTPQGEILDCDRILYLRAYLRAVHRAVAEGYPVEGYFLWSLLDNFEWSWGCDRRFGITWVDYETQTRIPKASYHWYAECIRQNRVV
jgi:beta-glucosidase